MTTTVSYVVCAHESRSHWAWDIHNRLGATVCFDNGRLGSLENHDRAWRTGESAGRDWVCVLEDDAVLTNWFHVQVAQAIESRPFEDAAISLYTGTAKPKQDQIINALKRARANDSAWLVSDSAYWGVGLLLPRHRVQPMLDYVQDRTEPYDERLSYFLRDSNIPCLYTNPSLVDHRDGESLIKPALSPRIAHRFGSRTEWNSNYIPIGRWKP